MEYLPARTVSMGVVLYEENIEKVSFHVLEDDYSPPWSPSKVEKSGIQLCLELLLQG